jgi:hypothetical protein
MHTQELWGELDRRYSQDPFARTWEELHTYQGQEAASFTDLRRSEHQNQSKCSSRPSSRSVRVDDHHANGQNGRIVPHGRSHSSRSQAASVSGSQHFQMKGPRSSARSGGTEHVRWRGDDDDADEENLLGGLHAVIDAGLLFLQGGYGLKS